MLRTNNRLAKKLKGKNWGMGIQGSFEKLQNILLF